VWLSEELGIEEAILAEGQADKAELLERLRQEVFRCQKCRLYKTKRNYVFGAGNPYAEIMFVGEAPGGEEDKQGIPFVGRAGKLLTKLLEEIGYTREQVYIANVLKCRPPQNRDPRQDEIAACSPYLDSQIKIIQPKVLCALGRFAAVFLLGKQIPLSQMRMKVHETRYGAKLIVTYHPAAVLRNPRLMDSARRDFAMLKAVVEGEGIDSSRLP